MQFERNRNFNLENVEDIQEVQNIQLRGLQNFEIDFREILGGIVNQNPQYYQILQDPNVAASVAARDPNALIEYIRTLAVATGQNIPATLAAFRPLILHIGGAQARAADAGLAAFAGQANAYAERYPERDIRGVGLRYLGRGAQALAGSLLVGTLYNHGPEFVKNVYNDVTPYVKSGIETLANGIEYMRLLYPPSELTGLRLTGGRTIAGSGAMDTHRIGSIDNTRAPLSVPTTGVVPVSIAATKATTNVISEAQFDPEIRNLLQGVESLISRSSIIPNDELRVKEILMVLGKAQNINMAKKLQLQEQLEDNILSMLKRRLNDEIDNRIPVSEFSTASMRQRALQPTFGRPVLAGNYTRI